MSCCILSRSAAAALLIFFTQILCTFSFSCNCTAGLSDYCSQKTGTCDAELTARKLKSDLLELYEMVEILRDFPEDRPRKESKYEFCSKMSNLKNSMDFLLLDYETWDPACINFITGGQRIYGCSLAPKSNKIGVISASKLNKKIKQIQQFVMCPIFNRGTQHFSVNFNYCQNKEYCVSSGSADISSLLQSTEYNNNENLAAKAAFGYLESTTAANFYLRKTAVTVNANFWIAGVTYVESSDTSTLSTEATTATSNPELSEEQLNKFGSTFDSDTILSGGVTSYASHNYNSATTVDATSGNSEIFSTSTTVTEASVAGGESISSIEFVTDETTTDLIASANQDGATIGSEPGGISMSYVMTADSDNRSATEQISVTSSLRYQDSGTGSTDESTTTSNNLFSISDTDTAGEPVSESDYIDGTTIVSLTSTDEQNTSANDEGSVWMGQHDGSSAATVSEGSLWMGQHEASTVATVSEGSLWMGQHDASTVATFSEGSLRMGQHDASTVATVSEGSLWMGQHDASTVATVSEGSLWMGQHDASTFATVSEGSLWLGQHDGGSTAATVSDTGHTTLVIPASSGPIDQSTSGMYASAESGGATTEYSQETSATEQSIANSVEDSQIIDSNLVKEAGSNTASGASNANSKSKSQSEMDADYANNVFSVDSSYYSSKTAKVVSAGVGSSSGSKKGVWKFIVPVVLIMCVTLLIIIVVYASRWRANLVVSDRR